MNTASNLSIKYSLSKNINSNIKTTGKNQNPGQPNNPNNTRSPNYNRMTDAQKRYLFRILAEQGIKGDKAHEYLKDLFKIESLKEVTKFEASRMIGQLLEKVER